MLCGSCGSANAATAKFCQECGTPLALGCPSCGLPITAEQKFCAECGSALAPAGGVSPVPAERATAGVPSAAQRRVCSVLFVDLVGFTPLSESRDAEDIRELLSQYFDVARTVITRYGGVVEKFIGDAVMAIWGTPVAVEGDAERAVRAGLDLVAGVTELGTRVGAPDLRARAGVVTGEVAVTVGVVGEGVAGDTVNTAARVQTAADPGAVFVDETTHNLTRAAIGFADTGEHVLKGKAEPMRLWEATRVLSGIGGAQRVDGLEAPFLGRDAELRAVKELFHAAVERRTPRMVVVSGPAGVGKSRFGWEFEKYIDGLATTVWWHRGRCLSYGEGVAFWALAEIVRQRMGIAEEDSTALAGEKLAEGLATYITDATERRYIAIRLGRLLGVPVADDPETALGRDELFAGWRLFFERLATTGPVLLVLEDAQHADAGLLEFLDHLVDWARDVSLFVLVFARPQLAELRPGWGSGRNRTALTLDPLDTASMDALVDALVPGMTDAARRAITSQAQGIPLFAVETVRTLIDRDIVVPRDGVYRLVGDLGALNVPDSLRGLLAARLDALDDKQRALVCDAAVLGTSFRADALTAVSGRPDTDVRPALDELVRREFFDISADPLSPQQGSYTFTQNLLRQVAYETMSRRDRKVRHLAVAAHLGSASIGGADEIVDVIARHYLDALRAMPDDSDAAELHGRAVATFVRAAERALRSGAPRSAAASYSTAAELVEQTADSMADAAALWEDAVRAWLQAGAYNETIAAGHHAGELYTALGQRRAAARSNLLAASAARRLYRFVDALELVNGALEVLSDEPDQDTVRALLIRAEIEAMTTGPDAVVLTAEALERGQALAVDADLLVDLFIIRAQALGFANRSSEGRANLLYAARLADETDNRLGRARALMNLSSFELCERPRSAVANGQMARDLCRQLGTRSFLPVAIGNLALALIWVGDWDAAQQVFDEGDRIDDLADNPDVLQVRALLAALRGDTAAAREIAGNFDTIEDDDAQNHAYVATVQAATAIAAGELENAVRFGLAAVANSVAIGLNSEVVGWSWAMAARAAQELGDTATLAELIAVLDGHPIGHLSSLLRAERDLAVARRDRSIDGAAVAVAALRHVDSPLHLALGLLDYAELLVAAGSPSEAGALVDEAEALAEALGSRPVLARIATVRERSADSSSLPAATS